MTEGMQAADAEMASPSVESVESKREGASQQYNPSSMYNLIKTLANDPLDSATEKIAAFVRKYGNFDEPNSKGSTGLHACAYIRRWDLAKALLDMGADPLRKNNASHSFFLTLVKTPDAPWREVLSSHTDLIEKHERFLETKSASPRPAKKDRSERRKLVEPINFDQFEALESMQVIGLDGGMISHGDLWNLLLGDLTSGNDDRAKRIFKLGALNFGYDPDGKTMGVLLVERGDRDLILRALNFGLPPSAKGRSGVSMLHAAVSLEREDLVASILLSGGDPNGCDMDGNTPLHVAAKGGLIDIAERLLAFDANSGIQNTSGETPYDIAKASGNYELEDFLAPTPGFESQANRWAGLPQEDVSTFTPRSEQAGQQPGKRRHGGSQRKSGAGRPHSGGGSGSYSGNGGKKRFVSVFDGPNKERSVSDAPYSIYEPSETKPETAPVVIVKKAKKLERDVRVDAVGGEGGEGIKSSADTLQAAPSGVGKITLRRKMA